MPVINLGLRICAHICFFDLLLDRRRVPGLSLCLGDAEAAARRICAYLLLQPMTIQRSLVGSTPRKYSDLTAEIWPVVPASRAA